MSTFKKAKVAMLPTEQKTNGIICKDITGQDRMINIKSDGVMEHEDYVGHHLYIISDDEIKEGDWCYNPASKSIFKTDSRAPHWFSECRKIIATTNNSLTEDRQKTAFVVTGHPLPQPSQQFIQKFVKEYNKGDVITDVLVEYEQKSKGFINALKGNYNYENILKINLKDNTITIKKVKNSWNREEVIKLLRDAHLDIVDGNYSKGLNKWIEENL